MHRLRLRIAWAEGIRRANANSRSWANANIITHSKSSVKSPNSKKSHTKMEISEYLCTKIECLLKNFQKTAKNIKKVVFYV